MKRIGIDVGGTFTDVYLDQDGKITVEKVPSTPDDPGRAVVNGLVAITEKAGLKISEIDEIVHGTTVATNIALTGKGAHVGLITTEGFRDILHIARHKKPLNFSLQQELPWQSRPLVKRRDRLTVKERITAPNGEVLIPIDEDEVREKVRTLVARGVESIAVCLLHAYLNPEHEQIVARIVKEEAPDVFLSVSSDVIPLYREYERFSTTALNAFVGPEVGRYLSRLRDVVKDLGFEHEIQLMQSSGGMTPIMDAAANPVSLMMSGPVGGLIGGIWSAQHSGFSNVITLDIGGTSADIGVAVEGELRMKHLLDTKIGDYQAMVPMVDIDTIGAGGGSIAYKDDGGVFRCGPQSAGARPGPACYGHGGTQPTSTDAQAILGRLRPERGLASGDWALDVTKSEAAFAPLAESINMSVTQAAEGALQLQRFDMAQAIERNSTSRGYDPRDLALVAAGGAGPLFSCELAAELNIPHVVVPAHPGIVAATGLLATDRIVEEAATERHILSGPTVPPSVEQRFVELEAKALDNLSVSSEEATLVRLADCRYEGQGYEVRFEVPADSLLEGKLPEFIGAFHAAHERTYGHRYETDVIELVNIRVRGSVPCPQLPNTEIEIAGSIEEALITTAPVVFAGESVDTPFYDRDKLPVDASITGPAIIEQYDTTTVVPPECVVDVRADGNLVIAVPLGESEHSDELAAPILMRVIGGAINSTAKEMASVMLRMAYSSIIRESEDLGAGIFDAEGNTLAESDTTPMFMGSMPKIVKGVIRLLDGDINEGDVILHNDPYNGATHSPDVAIVTPIFHEGELVAWAGASGQLLDIGGAHAGLMVDISDAQAEGQIFRALKIVEGGKKQDVLLKHILSNTRTPKQNAGDLEAMMAACRLAGSRYLEIIETYGRDAVAEACNQWLDYSERMMRQRIATVPDGVYTTETGWLDDDGRNTGVKLPIEVKVIIEGDTITYDLTGSSPQVPTAYNCAFEGTTVSAFSFITRMIFLDEATSEVHVPQNEGMLRPVNVIAPEGTIFNPTYPAATFARFNQVQRAVDMALRALAPVVPGQITAGNSAHLHFMSYSGWDEKAGEYWVYLECDEGAYGGRPESDGPDSVANLIDNTRNNPIEELEWRFPMLTQRYELRDDPAAPGEFRGGVGIVRCAKFLTDTDVTCEADRHEGDKPWGIFGGHDGLNASIVHNPGTPEAENWPSKVTAAKMKAGDSLQITVPSGGGYGDPAKRDPLKVCEDVMDGFATLEQAEKIYKVALVSDGVDGWVVDEEATVQART
ncbi:MULTISPECIES: hydantoinase B/oxoprolinase family protein [Actinomycetes]|uniref:hydantoinase B/oxoprolinase family protein n=1 Tax=Actinomycetes TaxID=1760 RepID=UPI002649DC87|nr:MULTISPECIES: hydantoinase B/oxoprolinase family protein [Actinomycetes]MDN6226990.1 hydantoinase B/oxoprolinase family protein [Corynebacterium flavescens]MDN6457023.1 hydantoinase B/oxoprolinase family protein [Yaniella sp.]MDN6646403.1 hydantoinase B/oxoprolinase family protein [Corynebacterium flavescens]MDN6688354.1 hydantoinase B/oxoprolinase family protein [Corynebacterium flavescens]